MYLATSADPWRWATLVVPAVAGTDPAMLTQSIRRAVNTVDPDLPIDDLRTGASLVSTSVAERRFAAGHVFAFATCAALLAAVGLYGVIAYSAAQRAGELGTT